MSIVNLLNNISTNYRLVRIDTDGFSRSMVFLTYDNHYVECFLSQHGRSLRTIVIDQKTHEEVLDEETTLTRGEYETCRDLYRVRLEGVSNVTRELMYRVTLDELKIALGVKKRTLNQRVFKPERVTIRSTNHPDTFWSDSSGYWRNEPPVLPQQEAPTRRSVPRVLNWFDVEVQPMDTSDLFERSRAMMELITMDEVNYSQSMQPQREQPPIRENERWYHQFDTRHLRF